MTRILHQGTDSALTRGIAREPCDRVVFATADVALGEFRCPVSYRGFRDAGRINHHVIVFPRASVWIEREDAPRFVADPGLATIFNPRLPYVRAPISPEGDLADWLGVSERFARDAVRQCDHRDAELDEPFRRPFAAVGNEVYVAQRALFTAAARGEIDALDVEERTLEIVGAVLRSSYRSRGTPGAPPRRGRPRRELVEDAKAAILLRLFENLSVGDLAGQIDVSPFHLCRAFRRETGMTLNAYRRDIRLRTALGLTAEYRGNLSALALRAGFYSHSHFSAAFSRAFGRPPSATGGIGEMQAIPAAIGNANFRRSWRMSAD
jgi:AraC-like DNA-binding protein